MRERNDIIMQHNQSGKERDEQERTEGKTFDKETQNIGIDDEDTESASDYTDFAGAYKRSLVMRSCSAAAWLYWCSKSSLPRARKPVCNSFFCCSPVFAPS